MSLNRQSICLTLTTLLLAPLAALHAADDIRWLVECDAKTLPHEQGWTAIGGLAAKTTTTGGSLHIVDDSITDFAAYRRAWPAPKDDEEIIVEARLRVGSVAMEPGKKSTLWPWRDGAPIGVLVSDGKHQGGLSLDTRRIRTFHDRFFATDTSGAFRTYRLIIRGGDMSAEVDGQRGIVGEGAFWKKADAPEPFIQFGSTAATWTSDAAWEYVKLGVRKTSAAPASKPALKITVSEPWEFLPKGAPRSTRPCLYNLGNGLLLLSLAQGPDKFYEPYGLYKSTDEGRTFTAVTGLELKTYAPLPLARLADGSILGVSRWNVPYDAGIYIGMSYRLDAKAETFTMFENKITMPKDTASIMVFERHLLDMPDGSQLVATFDKGRSSHLLRTTDRGQTWKHFSTIGKGGEPAVLRLADKRLLAAVRHNASNTLHQHHSEDGGKTWSEPRELEEGFVDPDLCRMSDGTLACSYGRPGNNLMFSLDDGATWTHHQVISAELGFNYASLVEVRPGRLLMLLDAPKLHAVYVDVERVKK